MMATGSGKSLCMFLPPLVCGTVAIAVIRSPLIGLMDELGMFLHFIWFATCSELILCIAKVMKLTERKLSAVRVSGDNKDLYRRVAVGGYQYGMLSDNNSLTQVVVFKCAMYGCFSVHVTGNCHKPALEGAVWRAAFQSEFLLIVPGGVYTASLEVTL